MTPERLSEIPPTGLKVIEALRQEHASERDLFIRLRPVDRLALHRFLPEMVSKGWIERYDRGRLPGPVVTTYCLPGERYR